jgi:hypothetical protein
MTVQNHEALKGDRITNKSLLRAAKVTPLNKTVLQNYMENEALKYPPNLLWLIDAFKPGWVKKTFPFVSLAGYIVGLCNTFYLVDEPTFFATVILWVIVPVSIVLYCKACAPAQWNRYALTENFYRSTVLGRDVQIPAYAYAMVQRIKAFAPDTEFAVCALENNLTGLDPVLKMIRDGEEIDLTAWDENGKEIIF